MKSLGREEDVQHSRKIAEGAQIQRYLKIPDHRAPWHFLKLDFSDSYVHWCDLDNGQTVRVVCGGGPEGQGMDPENCSICSYVMGLYKEGKKLRESGAEQQGGKLKTRANSIRANYEAIFVAVRGTGLVERIKVKGKDGQAKLQKKRFADFDQNSELEEADVEFGFIRLSRSAFQHLSDLIKDERYPFIRSGADLANRVIWSDRKTEKNRRFPETVWIPDAETSDPPELEGYDPEEWVPSEQFEIDEEEILKVYNYLTGETIEENDDEVELEDEEVDEEEEEPGDDYLDDVDDDADEESEGAENSEDEDVEEGDEDEADDAPEPPKKKSAAKGKSAQSSSKSKSGSTSKKRSRRASL